MATQILPLITKEVENRFWSKVERGTPNTCWPWKASCSTPGYGQFGLNRRVMSAHRLAWIIANQKEIPFLPGPHGACILHHCDNPKCCNPAHLFLGTQQANVEDMNRKGRHNSAKLTGESNPRAKISDHQVQQLRSLRASKNLSYRKLAKAFGISRQQARLIALGRSRRTQQSTPR